MQGAPSPDPVSSPEMPQILEKPPMEPQDRYGCGGKEVGEATCCDSRLGMDFSFCVALEKRTSSVALSFPTCAVELIILTHWFTPA